MRARSLTTTLALAFAGTTLAVFALVGSVLYFALNREIRQQDDIDLVLVTRHTRRLAEELTSLADVRAHADRLTSQVLGQSALSMQVRDSGHEIVVAHNVASEPPVLAQHIGASQRITEGDIGEWHDPRGVPVRGLAADAVLRDGTPVTIVVARDMTDRWRLLDRYRERLYGAGFAGMLLAFLMSWMLVRESLKPLRDVAARAATITVDRLDRRLSADNAPQELTALVASLNAMLERLQGGFARLSQYTADLAHDMRTPLNNLRGATEVTLARPRGADEYQTLLASNLEECERISRMIESVLFLARAEHPQFVTAMQPLHAARELEKVADYFEGVADDAGVHLLVRGEGEVRADAELFRRALSNLLANALRYTPRGGTITMSAEDSPRALVVTVANEGEPIDPAIIGRIFERFYRADPSRKSDPKSAGSAGLGLAIVRTIMELHGGTAHAQSDGQGTRFILTFAHR
jgi:two-component system heavy metal sensor histidine kinase CusS